MMPMSLSDHMDVWASRVHRLTPAEARTAAAEGAVLVDLRERADIEAEGSLPDSVQIRLSVLPWRCDPEGERADPRVADPARHIVLVCNDGYSSLWAAALLTDMGFERAGDMIGGFHAWQAAGLPVIAPN